VVKLESNNITFVGDGHLDSTSHHHRITKCIYPYSALYIYTEPVEMICTILTHNGSVVNATGAPWPNHNNPDDLVIPPDGCSVLNEHLV
jgi:hypothetical protein